MEFDIVRATFLSFIQGLTEFLPISSSAHLILPSALLGWDDQGLSFDVAVHLGTLSAVLIYFRHDVWKLIHGCSRHLLFKEGSDEAMLGWKLLLATFPVIIAGYLGKEFIDTSLRATAVIATTTIVYGVLLLWSDRHSSGKNTLDTMTWRQALIIGFAQMLALVPGTSRSGITMTAALFCNLDRESSSRFSFLLSIPVIAGASLFLVLDLIKQAQVNWGELFYGMVLAGLVAYACVTLFLNTISRLGFLPFVIYRFFLGTLLFLFFV